MRSSTLLTVSVALIGLLPGLTLASELELAKVSYQPVVSEYQSDAVVEAVNRSTVSAQTSGRVSELLVDINDTVEKGAVIVRLQDVEQRAALERAEAGLTEAEARANEARAQFTRIKRVFDRRLVSRSQLDAADANRNAAEARLAGARAEVETAREQLGYTVITAPYGGIVLDRHVDIGEAVRPGSPLMTGVSLESLRVLAQIPQQLVAQVREHRQARVLPDQGEPIEVVRLTVFPYASENSGAFKVRAYLPAGAPGLFPGMFVKVAFVVGDAHVLVVPRRAVVRRSELTAVYVVAEDGRVSLRQVRVGSTKGEEMEVLAGLQEGERVALDPIRAGIALKAAQPGVGEAS
jgi:RND family efflux transporter MFP subunit